MKFEQSLANHLPIDPSLKCGEELLSPDAVANDDECDDEHFNLFNFHITLPPSLRDPPDSQSPSTRLNFRSPNRSSATGVLLETDRTTPKESESTSGGCDPHFFARGFPLEAKTGFAVWPGSRLLLQSLLCDPPGGGGGGGFERLRRWRSRLLRLDASGSPAPTRPLNVLEVGSGIGAVGTALASAGASVVATDLPVLARCGIAPNLRRNRSEAAGAGGEGGASSFASALHPSERDGDGDGGGFPVAVGRGWARPAVLDWFRPVSSQLPSEVCENVDVIVACDCIFLRKIVDPLLDTVSQIFERSEGRETTCLFTYQRRNLAGVFIPLEELLSRIHSRGWKAECLAWRKVAVEEDGEHDLYLFELSPGDAEARAEEDGGAGDEEKKE